MKNTYARLSLLLGFVILVTGVVTAGVFYYESQHARCRDEAQDAIADVADLKVDELSLWRRERLGDAGTLYKNTAFSSLVRRCFEQPDDLSLQKELQSWISNIRGNDRYDQIALHNAESGKWTLLSEKKDPFSSFTIQNVHEAERSGQVTFLDFHRNEYTQRVYLSLLVPILDNQAGGRAIGTVVLRIDPNAFLYSLLQRWPTPSGTAEILLVRREENEVVFLNELRFRKDTALNLRLSLEDMNIPAVRVALGGTGSFEGTDYRGVRVLAAIRAVPDSPWFLVAKIDAAEVYAPMRERFWTTLALVIALVTAIGLTVGLIWWRQRVRFYQERFEAAEALRAVDANLAITLKSIGDAVISTDLAGKVVHMNPVAEALTGWKLEEAVGRTLAEVFHIFNALTHQRATDPVARVLETGQIVGLANHTVLVARGGIECQIADSASPIRDADGKTRGVVLIFRDVTQEHAAATALEASELRYRRLFEAAKDGILILDAETGMIVDVNPFLIEMLGLSHEAFLGKKVWELGFLKEILADESKLAELQQKEYIRYEDVPLETADGRRIDVEFVSNVYRVIHHKVIQCNLRDITERKRAMEALRQSEEKYELERKYRAILDQTFEFVGLMTPDGTLIEANRAALAIAGANESDVLGKPFWETPWWTHSTEMQQRLREGIKAAANGEFVRFEATHPAAPTGEIHYVDFSLKPVKNENGEVVFLIPEGRDVTDQKRAEEGMREFETRFRDVVDNSREGVIFVDMDEMTIFSANRAMAALLGRSPEEFIGMPISEIHPADSFAEVAREFERHRTGEQDFSSNIPLIRKDGTRLYADITSTVVTLNGIKYLAGFFRDVTDRKQAEDALRESEERFRGYVENANDVVYSLTPEGIFTYVSPNWLDIMGQPADEAIGKSFEDYVHPDDVDVCREALARALAMAGKRSGVEYRVLHRDGTYRWHSTKGAAIHDRDGNVVGCMGIARDDTERKETERRQRLSAEVLGILNNPLSLSDAIHRILDAIKRATGFDAVGIRLRSGEEFPYFSQNGFSDDFLLSENTLITRGPDGGPCEDENGNRSLECTCGLVLSGQTNPTSPLFTPGGSFWTNDLLPLLDLPADEDLGLHPRNRCIHEGFRSVALIPVRANQTIVGLLQLNDRRKGCFSLEMVQFFEGISASIGVALVRKQMEEALRQSKEELEQDAAALETANKALEESKHLAETATRAKSAFLAAMSHEIRTPLNAVIGMTGLLLDTSLDTEQREYSETVRVSGEVLLSLINDILDFSKIEAERMELENYPFDMTRCLEESLELVGPGAMEKGIEMAYEVEGDLPCCFVGDVTRLRQILVNLLSNGVKFTEKGEVVVTLSDERHDNDLYQLHFAVRDTGMGIPADRQERLFQPFSQIDVSTSRRFGGSGLGLAISRRLAEMMGGRMWVESTGVPGEGATFHFTIKTTKAAEQSMPDDLPAENVASLAGRTLLVVDDNKTSRNILVAQAKRWAMLPTAVESGIEAMTLLERGDHFDLAILDMHMPEMDGVELAGEIKGMLNPPEMPLILLSSVSHRMSDIENEWFAARLTKPVRASQLCSVLCRLLDEDAAPGPSEQDQHSPEEHDVEQRRHLRVLLAEDNLINQKVALRMLTKLGYRADAVANGLEALRALQQIPYDVILMDCQMPEMDGYEATRRIRVREQEEGLTPVHIIAMTAHAMQGDRDLCLDAGMDDYLAKPVRANQLEKAMERCLPVSVAELLNCVLPTGESTA